MCEAMLSKLQKIVVDEAARNEPLAKEIQARFGHLPIEYTGDFRERKKSAQAGDLLVTVRRDRFIRKCPGTQGYSCCDYYVFNLGIGCFYNCSYCFLLQYMNTPYIAYVNLDDFINAAQDFCRARAGRTIRLGSGEFVDSVGFNEIAGFNERLVPALSKIDNLIFEIKTKSSNIEHLLNLNHRGKVVVSWSLNAEEIADADEEAAPTVSERITAAVQCASAGYKVGFHFDPVVHFPGWQSGYERVIDALFNQISPASIAWISLGALRFNPAQKAIMKREFPKSRLSYGELVPGLDGKLRYFLPIRQMMFAALIKRIRSHAPGVSVYLCMEKMSVARALFTPDYSLFS